jgi:hypothetical protein
MSFNWFRSISYLLTNMDLYYVKTNIHFCIQISKFSLYFLIMCAFICLNIRQLWIQVNCEKSNHLCLYLIVMFVIHNGLLSKQTFLLYNLYKQIISLILIYKISNNWIRNTSFRPFIRSKLSVSSDTHIEILNGLLYDIMNMKICILSFTVSDYIRINKLQHFLFFFFLIFNFCSYNLF